MQEIIIVLVSFTLGSFSNTVISYYIGSSKLDLKRSYCFCGSRKLKVYELIPVISYLALKGRCQSCKKNISIRFLLVELLFPFLGLLCFYKYGFTISFVLTFICFCLLIIIGIVDYHSFMIPNSLIIILSTVLILKAIYINENILPEIIASISIALLFILVNYLFMKIKEHDVIGFGDIKLLMALMFLVKVPLSLFALWFSSLIAIPVFFIMKLFIKRFSEEIRIPFGVFLGIGFILVKYFSEDIYSCYFSLLERI
ncbi:MAG: prepilin peptidase [Bacteroidota bacterium]|nr:prepilin peptidase [Bacteroidota bacterium]